MRTDNKYVLPKAKALQPCQRCGSQVLFCMDMRNEIKLKARFVYEKDKGVKSLADGVYVNFCPFCGTDIRGAE